MYEFWREQAACKGVEPDLFFPSKNGGYSPVQWEAVLEVCERCPVRSDCLNYALDNNIVHGIWGGMSVRKRRKAALLRNRGLDPMKVL